MRRLPPALQRVAAVYRRSGADLPFGDPLPTHGAEMEGWFWRFTDVASGRVVVALCGVNRHPGGDWATVALAAHPGGFVRSAAVPNAWAERDRFRLGAGDVLRADESTVRVDFGEGARLEARLDDVFGWPLAMPGGGLASITPFLGQYWHPHVLGARVTGVAEIDGATWDLGGATAYAEKNWGRGFPERWWWGQAQGFERADVCVAFGGGYLTAGPVGVDISGVVVRVGDDVIRLAPPLAVVRTDVRDGCWHLRARDLRWEVEVTGDPNGTEPHVLPVPLPAERRNVDTDFEHLAGRIRLSVRRRGEVVFSGESALAALEVGSRPT